ncbi:tetratricopeptide repeat protein [Melghirimyces algeriensis]|uniref:Flp pilus assembly protein TadD, contains TPR repeats n=1 Tax=Melghirimyces algeriensis TaxID=910412 RepID=A0A521D0Y7_9BACL|nr:tetratricopeptide repeat protein [Melghirimyces algeriensis]SMO65353.1 Flp pilus assembly protein TadD, contains TPR repeats [Melghirimyces algeriensis]
MKKQCADVKKPSKGHKVVQLRLDAGFFFERAVRSLDRHRYDQALKYFRLAVEKEPDNPVNLCNLAGILSEMGRFEESNEILEKILSHADPELYECWFYMANNAANLEDFERAEDYLIRYLEVAPKGEFVSEAEEMLDMLAYEQGRSPRRPKVKPKQDWLIQHDEASNCLESGQFFLAAEILEELIKKYPNFYPGKNNLALAYYYMGDVKKATELIQQVLEADPHNLHALCNLAILFQHQRDRENRERLVTLLKKWVPLQLEHMYKLAITLGILGEHQAALWLFRKLLKREERPDSSLYHYLAAAAFNNKRFQLAQSYWRIAQELDPESDIPSFYLSRMDRWSNLYPSSVPTVSYHYQLPFEEQLMQLTQHQHLVPELVQQNPLLRSSFFWALNHGDKETKLQVLQVFEWIADREVEQVLRCFLMKQNEDDDLKRFALHVLSQMGMKDSCCAILDGQERMIRPNELTEQLPECIKQWEKVLECCLKKMDGDYDLIQMNDVQIIWKEFLQENQADLPKIRKVEGWAAALEYIVARLHGISLSLKCVAGKHHVSSSTVGRHVRVLKKVCPSIHKPGIK